MGNDKFTEIAINLVRNLYRIEFGQYISNKEVYVVWLSKTLQNNKALLSTDIPDKRYFEITYNGDKKEFYVDAYRMTSNTPISLEDAEGLIDE